MHNLISQNQLAYWNKIKDDAIESEILMNDYLECLSESVDNESRRRCRLILSQ
jgi:hypothetical protein